MLEDIGNIVPLLLPGHRGVAAGESQNSIDRFDGAIEELDSFSVRYQAFPGSQGSPFPGE
jgi:hypothetical protein